jgi:hypothetical protein
MASPKTLVAAACAAVFLLSTVLLAQHSQHGGSTRIAAAQAAQAPAKPVKPAPAGALPPLPRVPYEPARPMAVVQQVYEFAARHPEVLQHVPCFCGCERMGHSGNHDCFVKGRAADGRITEWEAHGIGCQICIDVGRDAMLLFNSGASVTAIRDAIDKKYRAHFPSSTPTPPPAQKGTGRRS